MSAVVLPAASAAFTSTQVIFSNSTRSACARGKARADPAASIRETVPPAINISKECETESVRKSFSFAQKNITRCSFNGEPPVRQVHYYHDNIAVSARFEIRPDGVQNTASRHKRGRTLYKRLAVVRDDVV